MSWSSDHWFFSFFNYIVIIINICAPMDFYFLRHLKYVICHARMSGAMWLCHDLKESLNHFLAVWKKLFWNNLIHRNESGFPSLWMDNKWTFHIKDGYVDNTLWWTGAYKDHTALLNIFENNYFKWLKQHVEVGHPCIPSESLSLWPRYWSAAEVSCDASL